MLNALKQAVQFGLQDKVHLAGAQQEMEPLEGLPPEARIGIWGMKWCWNQPGVPHVADFVEAAKKRTGRVPTARTWFGYVSVWTCALAAAEANSLKALDMAKALQDFHLPPEVALGPNPAFYRAGQETSSWPRCSSARRRPRARRLRICSRSRPSSTGPTSPDRSGRAAAR